MIQLQLLESRDVPATYTVITDEDNAINPPVGSLREAIRFANDNKNGNTPDIIDFNIGNGDQVIKLVGAELPAIDDAVIIDGSTRPEGKPAQRIILDGALVPLQPVLLPPPRCGLSFITTLGNVPRSSSDSRVLGLVFKSFDIAVLIENVSRVQIGGVGLNQENMFGFNREAAVQIAQTLPQFKTDGNNIAGNTFGMIPSEDESKNKMGIVVSGDKVTGTIIFGNVIVNNYSCGISIDGADETHILKNLIGTPNGIDKAGNGTGIEVYGKAQGTHIGGAAKVNAAGFIEEPVNVISGNFTGITLSPTAGVVRPRTRSAGARPGITGIQASPQLLKFQGFRTTPAVRLVLQP